MATGRHTASSLRTDTAMVLVSGIGGTPVHAELRYRCDDPFAVQLRLSIPGSQLVIWTVGRDLLSTVSPSPAAWVTCTSIPPAAASSSNSARRHPPRGWSPTGASCRTSSPPRRPRFHPAPRSTTTPSTKNSSGSSTGKEHRPDRAGVTPHRTVPRPAGFRSICECGTKRVTKPAHPSRCDPRGPLSSWGTHRPRTRAGGSVPSPRGC